MGLQKAKPFGAVVEVESRGSIARGALHCLPAPSMVLLLSRAQRWMGPVPIRSQQPPPPPTATILPAICCCQSAAQTAFQQTQLASVSQLQPPQWKFWAFTRSHCRLSSSLALLIEHNLTFWLFQPQVCAGRARTTKAVALNSRNTKTTRGSSLLQSEKGEQPTTRSPNISSRHS